MGKWFEASNATGWILFLVVGFLVLYPVSWLLVGSFLSGRPGITRSFTLSNYINVYLDPSTYRLLWNSIVIVGARTLVGGSLAIFMAWVVTRTNVPCRRVLEALLIMPMFVPNVLETIGWSILLSPKSGLINSAAKWLFGLSQGPFNVYSLTGLIWVMSVESLPLMFLLIVSAFRAVDPALENAAAMSGASYPRVFFRVTLPLLLPAVLGALTLTFVRGMEAFETPTLIGLPARVYVFTNQIYEVTTLKMPPRYGEATALGLLLFFITAVLVLFQQRMLRGKEFFVVTGRGYQQRVIELGWARWLLFLASAFLVLITLVLPVSQVIVGSFQGVPGLYSSRPGTWTLAHYAGVFQSEAFWRSLRNSFVLAGAAGLMTVIMGLLIAYVIHRTLFPLRKLFDFLVWIPWTLPGLVMGLGMLWAYIYLPDPFNLYGTAWLLIIAFITSGLPLGVRLLAGALVQIHPSLEQAGWSSGANRLTSLWFIILPLMRPALLSGFIILFSLFIRQLSTVVLLYSEGSELLSITLFSYFQNGELGPACAVSVVVLLIVFLTLGIAGGLTPSIHDMQ
ncbi:MAG: iron ABC transporter permease [Deltaproteobacteria bacterium]|nr:iron ABC transporter permease [Deltaproteobacteria bacterium]